MRTVILIITVFLMSCAVALAQSGKKNKKKDKKKSQTEVRQPTSMDPSYPTPGYAPKYERKAKSIDLTYNAEKRYYQQKQKIAKDRKKAEKELMKPQYTDPMYFGHKRPPKKHKPGKMKYCKECGIRH